MPSSRASAAQHKSVELAKLAYVATHEGKAAAATALVISMTTFPGPMEVSVKLVPTTIATNLPWQVLLIHVTFLLISLLMSPSSTS